MAERWLVYGESLEEKSGGTAMDGIMHGFVAREGAYVLIPTYP